MKIYEIKPGVKKVFHPSNTDKKRTFNNFLSECSESIEAYKLAGQFMYRGIDFAPEIFLGRPRENRQPLDTGTIKHIEINRILKDTGFVANRSNSIFCTGDPSATPGYGTRYTIFPKNGFSFTWSTKVRDFTQFTSGVNADQLYKFSKERTEISNEIDIARDKVGELNRNLYDLLEVYNSEKKSDPNRVVILASLAQLRTHLYRVANPIMYKPDPADVEAMYKLSNTLHQLDIIDIPQQVLKQIESISILGPKLNSITSSTDHSIVDGLGFKNTDLAAAIKSKNEIMVHGEYYAFLYNKYDSSLVSRILKGRL